MLVGILAVCIAVLVLVQPLFFARDDRGNVTEFSYIIAEDKMNNSEFIQDTTLSLDYLADDFNNLPEIQDGVSEEEIKAAEQIANLMRSTDPEVQQGLQLIEKYGVPPEEKGHWIDFETPKYNTQLEVLFWLAETNRIDEDYERVALALALDYGSVVAIADDHVDRRVKNFVSTMYEILEDKKIPWKADDGCV